MKKAPRSRDRTPLPQGHLMNYVGKLILPAALLAAVGCAHTVPPLRPPEVVVKRTITEEAPKDDIQIIGREYWAKRGPILSKIDRMGHIYRITIHHEGRACYQSDWGFVVRRIRGIQKAHLRNGWADIGYHFVIDGRGRIWEARPLKYQGAHAGRNSTANNNKGNIGIVVLGDFNSQRLTDDEKASLGFLIDHLCKTHHISKRNIYTHRELKNTECPGRFLQDFVNKLRR